MISSSPLYFAAEGNHIDAVHLLFKNGAIYPDQDRYMSPLSTAVRANNIKMVSVLLDNGADTNARSLGCRSTTLHAAIDLQLTNMVELLLSYRTNMNPDDDMKLLHTACQYKNADIVGLLLDTGIDINNVMNDMSCLEEACAYECIDVVRLLIARGAKINRPGCTSALRHVISVGNIEIAQILIDNGVKLNAKYGAEPAIFTTINYNHPELLRLFFKHGMSEHITYKGQTPLDTITTYYMQEMQEKLIKHIREGLPVTDIFETAMNIFDTHKNDLKSLIYTLMIHRASMSDNSD